MNRVFLDAAKAIEKGWVQRVSRKWDKEAKHERVCLTTALEDATGKHGYHEAFDQLWKEIGQHPEAWNDHPSRTKKEVIRVLKRLGHR